MIVKTMENELLEQLAKEIAKSKHKYYILNEIEWMLNGHYTKCHFLAILIGKINYREEYYKLAEELQDRNLLLKLYNSIQEAMREQS
jgi:hypothetical protein